MSDDAELRAMLEVLASRPPPFDIAAYCFPEQLAFIQDPARFKAADCSRRAGKTVGIAADLLDTAQRHPNMACLYITLSRLNAKRILWRDLTSINSLYGLGGKEHATELTMTMPNGHIIYLSGAKDKSEVEKYRGFPLKKVYIDEAQSFRSYLRELVDDVLAKSLYDFNGSLALTGTPPPIPVGFFHECVHSDKWSRHSWNMMANPHLKIKSGREPMELILEDCARMGVSIDDPAIQRECFGRWTVDTNSLVFRWSDLNHFDDLPTGSSWSYVIGVDLGYSDADAIAVLAWSEASPSVYLVHESVKRKQGVTELAAELGKLVQQYDPLALVMDTGGLGKKIAEEMVARYSLPIKPAQKAEKYAHIELVNDALRTKRLFARRDSAFAQDSMLLEWDRDKSSGDKLVVSDAFHSDICDAVLYAYRAALGWLHTPVIPKPKLGSAEWLKAQVAEHEAAIIRQLEQRDQFDPALADDPDPQWRWQA